MVEIPQEIQTNQNIPNKMKIIELISKDNKKTFEVKFKSEVSALIIEAKLKNAILPEIFSDNFTFEYIKKIKFFNDDYESLDDCVSEIFDKLDRNETKLEIKKDYLIVKVPLYSRKYPEIAFCLKKKEFKTDDKFNELFELFKKSKEEQEKEVKSLKERISYLEDLLKIKKNFEIPKEDEFKGSIIKMKCFGNNEFNEFFDTSCIPNSNKLIWSFALSCKNEKDIPLAINTFNQYKDNAYSENSKYIFTRVKNNKIFFDFAPDCSNEKEIRDPIFDDLFEKNENEKGKGRYLMFLNLFFAIGNSLTIRTNAIPYDLYEEYNEEKILKFILDSELEFENISPQVQLFTFLFHEFYEKFDFYILNNFTKRLFRDIFLKIMAGNFKYKIPKEIINQNVIDEEYGNDVQAIYDFLKYIIRNLIYLFRFDEFKDSKIIDFNEIEIYLISQIHKSGFAFKIRLPKFNELIDDRSKGKIVIENYQ